LLIRLQPRDTAQAFLKRPRVILLVVLGFVVPTLGFSLLQPPVYEASAKLLVGARLEPDDFITEVGLPRDVRAAADAIDSPPVAEEVIRRLGLSGMEPAQLLENLSVEEDPGTLFINLFYRDIDPKRAQLIVNTFGAVSSERVSEAIGTVAKRGGYDGVGVRMWEDASVPDTPVSPDPVRYGILALISGLMAGLGLAMVMPRRGLGDNALASPPHKPRLRPAASPAEKPTKEQEVLEALGRVGELTAARAALETPLTVEEAERVLSGLAAKGHLRIRARGGGIFYSFWPRDAPSS
jgi:uncharacterized protein involved in exopolysaccharide biosynthesis